MWRPYDEVSKDLSMIDLRGLLVCLMTVTSIFGLNGGASNITVGMILAFSLLSCRIFRVYTVQLQTGAWPARSMPSPCMCGSARGTSPCLSQWRARYAFYHAHTARYHARPGSVSCWDRVALRPKVEATLEYATTQISRPSSAAGLNSMADAGRTCRSGLARHE